MCGSWLFLGGNHFEEDIFLYHPGQTVVKMRRSKFGSNDKWKCELSLFCICGEWKVGRGQGGHNLPLPVPRSSASVLFCPFVSRLPPFIVFLPLSCKSGCLTPYSNKECFGLVQNKKNCVVNRTTPHSPARSLKRHSFDTILHHAAKLQCFQLWTTVVRSELPGRSSMDGFFPTTPKIMVFDNIWPDSLCRSYREFRQLAR